VSYVHGTWALGTHHNKFEIRLNVDEPVTFLPGYYLFT